MSNSIEIVVAGASGYIGKAILPRLLEKFPTAHITALSRSQQSSNDPRIEWRPCDLFSLKAIEDTLPKKIDLAVYLVHSMGPTAQLDQGSFADYDLILADNFSRALKAADLKQLIYLGGLIPENETLSLHLQSRLEMEETFKSYKLPTTVFRAALILGDAGSSYQILLKLVERLPVMICPRWTQTLTTPVDLVTTLEAMVDSALNENAIGRTYDLAGCEPLTYMQMMRETARKVGKKRWFVTVPLFTPTLSQLWVRLITGSPKNLVYPLIESLEHPMVARKDRAYFPNGDRRTYFELLEKAILKTHSERSHFVFRAQRKTVRSVQRLPLPPGRDAAWVKDQYLEWLPRFLSPWISVMQNNGRFSFSLFNLKIIFLELTTNITRSTADRQVLDIGKGLMVASQNTGRLEFREVLNKRYVLAEIHNYTPALPWYAYIYTQAKLHLFVMRAFARYLRAN